jgi:uncharacterized iron-regulated membrane protein
MSDKTIRQSMAIVHTWGGVILGSVLMVIFLMGSLSVFDREIDRWMMPATRLVSSDAPLSLERQIAPAIVSLAQHTPVTQWSAFLPDTRNPTAEVAITLADGSQISRYVNPQTVAPVAAVGTLGATSFFFPMHYRLHLTFAQLGYWIVGLAGLAMLLALITGVVIHVRIFKDFFTFRPTKQLQRSALDLHNLSGVLALPFHFVITLSGLVILFSIYFPAGMHALYPDNDNGFYEDALALYSRPPATVVNTKADTAKMPQRAGQVLPQASVDAMLEQAVKVWGGGRPSFVRVFYPNDANAYVEISRATADRVGFDQQTIYFDGTDGHLLHYQPLKPVAAVQRYLSGLHLAQFGHWPLRWLYFLAGLSGCIMMGSGFVVWSEKRADKHAKAGHCGARLVSAVACFSTTSLVLATLSMLVANRLLPLELPQRALVEALVFFMVWLAGGLHAAIAVLRYRPQHPQRKTETPWLSQTWAIALLAALAPVLNWITTGDQPVRTLMQGNYAVLGVDSSLLVTALIAVWSARCIQAARHRRAASPPVRPAAPASHRSKSEQPYG